MCGIQGFFTQNPTTSDDEFRKKFTDALDLIRYRGPDGGVVWAQDHVMFGHRRLSIIDLSDDGIQPMTKGDLTITFNGEIYNYIELREELAKLGVLTKTATDTEVILNAYKTWGVDCFKKFNGMWAMAIWDAARKELVLSRDRFGVKPLYLMPTGEGLYFASEIKQLLKLSDKPAAWNSGILSDFISQNLLHHSVESIYAGIYSMRPAHYMRINLHSRLDSGSLISEMKQYWDLPVAEVRMSFEDAAEKCRELFYSAVTLRLRSDVPVGSALSGGIDSSAIVAAISKLKPKRQKTFSAVYPGEKVDEKRFAEMVVAGKDIDAIYTIPTAENLEKDFQDLVYHQDGPIFSLSMYAQWEVYRAAKKHNIRVMLDGQGADEIFGGYEGYLRAHLLSVHDSDGLAAAAFEGARFVLNHKNYYIGKIAAKFGKAENVLAARSDPSLWFGSVSRKYEDPLKESLYRSATRTSLPALLMFADRSSMAFSIESRTPYLDYRLAEFAFSCPASFHMRNGRRKTLLREAFKGLIPDEIRERNDKLGFAAPPSLWKRPKSVKTESIQAQPWVKMQ